MTRQKRSSRRREHGAVTHRDVDRLYRRPPSLSEWLPWTDFDPDSQTFTLEDGYSAAVMFEITGIATEACTDTTLAEIRANLQTCLNHTIPQHDQPFVLQCYVSDEPSLEDFAQTCQAYAQRRPKPSAAHQRMTEAVQAHLHRHLKHITGAGEFEDTAVTGGRWRGRVRRVRLFLYRRRDADGSLADDPVTDVQQVAERFMTQMVTSGVCIRRCDDQALYAWLLGWFNPQLAQISHDGAALATHLSLPAAEDQAYGHDLSQSLFLSQPRSDGEHGVWWFDDWPHRVLTVDALRRKPAPGHFTGERQIGENRYALFDKLPAGSILAITLTLQPQDRVENQVVQILHAAKGDTADAVAAAEEAQQALHWMAQGDALLPTVISIYLRGESLTVLQQRTQAVHALLLANGLHALRERDELLPLDTYIHQLPMNYEPARDRLCRRGRLMFSSDLAHLLPCYGRSRGTGHPGLVFFNRGGEPLCFDPLNPADRAKNAFGLVLGPPGSGKSALMVYVLLQLTALYGARVYIIEKGGSFTLFGDYCRALGLHVNRVALHPSEDISLPPFAEAYAMLQQEATKQRTPTPTEDSAEDVEDSEDAGRDLLGEMELKARLMITGGDAKEEARLSRADRLVLRQAIVHAAQFKQAQQPDKPVLTEDVVAALNTLAQQDALTATRRERITDMADALALYCSGMAGQFFNRPGQAWPDADVTVLEMGLLANEGYEDQLALGFIGLMNQINGVVEREQYRERPTFVLVDEAHLITTNPLLSVYLVKIVKMWRKLGAWLWLATQNLEDFPNAAKKLLSLFEWWIAMVCPKEEIEQIARFKDLSPEHKHLLLAARKEPGKYTEGVVLSDKLQCLFRNVPPPIALALAMTEKHEKQQRAAIMQAEGCTELEAALRIAERLQQTSTAQKD